MTKGDPIVFGPKYRAAQAQQQLMEGLKISQTISFGELLVLASTRYAVYVQQRVHDTAYWE